MIKVIVHFVKKQNEKKEDLYRIFFENNEQYIEKFGYVLLHEFKAKTTQEMLDSYILIEVEHNSKGTIYRYKKLNNKIKFMNALERDKKLNELKRLIEKKTRGNAKELASKISVSRATLFRLMNHLKIREMKEIKYCKQKNCYYFKKNEK